MYNLHWISDIDIEIIEVAGDPRPPKGSRKSGYVRVRSFKRRSLLLRTLLRLRRGIHQSRRTRRTRLRRRDRQRF